MPALGWALVLAALAPAAGLAPHHEPPGRHLQQQHGACRRTTYLVAQERPAPTTRRWSFRLEQQLQRYQAALEASPMRTQMVTAALLAGLGDAIAQRIEARATAFAWRRFASLIFVNVVYIVPLLMVLYAANDKLVGERTAKHGEVARTGAMLAVDQLINAPLCILGFYYAFSVSAVLFGAEPFLRGTFPGWAGVWHATNAEVRTKFRETLVKNWQVWVLPQLLHQLLNTLTLTSILSVTLTLTWQVWVLPQLLNFALVPPKLRLEP